MMLSSRPDQSSLITVIPPAPFERIILCVWVGGGGGGGAGTRVRPVKIISFILNRVNRNVERKWETPRKNT